jgi:hypothetical protein
MSDQADNLSEELKNLLTKTTTASRLFTSEGTRYIKNLNLSENTGGELVSKQAGLLKETFTSLMKLNMLYASSLVDLGIAWSKKMNEGGSTDQQNGPAETGETRGGEPAFILQATGVAGGEASAVFLLDSGKKEAFTCKLKETGYVLQNDDSALYRFETLFNPQSFELSPGQSQEITVSVKIPSGTKPGMYRANILADGFEHSYFTLFLTITEPETKTPPKERQRVKDQKTGK